MRFSEIARSRSETELSETTQTLLERRAQKKEDYLSVPLNRCHTTRKCCVSYLAVAFVADAAILSYGIYTISKPHSASGSELRYHSTLREVVPLTLNLSITLLTEELGLIHATSLRSNLMREGRLEFNNNVRLFIASHRVTPNSWYCNLMYIIFLIICYTSSVGNIVK